MMMIKNCMTMMMMIENCMMMMMMIENCNQTIYHWVTPWPSERLRVRGNGRMRNLWVSSPSRHNSVSRGSCCIAARCSVLSSSTSCFENTGFWPGNKFQFSNRSCNWNTFDMSSFDWENAILCSWCLLHYFNNSSFRLQCSFMFNIRIGMQDGFNLSCHVWLLYVIPANLWCLNQWTMFHPDPLTLGNWNFRRG